MYATIGDPRQAEDLYRRTLTEKEKMLMEDSMLGMDESMCKYHTDNTSYSTSVLYNCTLI